MLFLAFACVLATFDIRPYTDPVTGKAELPEQAFEGDMIRRVLRHVKSPSRGKKTNVEQCTKTIQVHNRSSERETCAAGSGAGHGLKIPSADRVHCFS